MCRYFCQKFEEENNAKPEPFRYPLTLAVVIAGVLLAALIRMAG